MRNQIASEIRKLTTTRSVYLLLAALAVVVGLGALAITTDGPVHLSVPLEHQPFLNAALTITPIFALLLGIRSFTDEFRFGSIVPTLLANPGRRRVLGAKVVTAAGAGVTMAVGAAVVALAVGVPILIGKGWDPTWSVTAVGEVIGRLVGVTVLWTAIGVGLGLAVRHQVAAIAGSLIWMVAGEGILAGFLPDLASYFPGAAGYAILGIDAGDLLTPAVGAIVLGGYALVAVAVGDVLMRRRDIA